MGKEHPDTATIYINMAVVYDAQGEYEKVLEYFNKALLIYKSKLGEKHPHTVSLYDRIKKLQDKINSEDI